MDDLSKYSDEFIDFEVNYWCSNLRAGDRRDWGLIQSMYDRYSKEAERRKEVKLVSEKKHN